MIGRPAGVPSGRPVRQPQGGRPVGAADPQQDRTGLLVTSALFELHYANTAAVRILSFPDEIAGAATIERRLRSIFGARQAPSGAPPDSAFMSGRRRYICRPFQLDGRSSRSQPPMFGFVLERPRHDEDAMADIRRRFHLSPRESESVRHLLHGLTTKEVAQQMNVSPNTVKQYVRLVMSKMGVTTRTGIVGKVLTG